VPPSLEELVAQAWHDVAAGHDVDVGIAARAAAWLYGIDVPSTGSDAGGGGSVAIHERPMIAVR
jgi:hypothetical protein